MNKEIPDSMAKFDCQEEIKLMQEDDELGMWVGSWKN